MHADHHIKLENLQFSVFSSEDIRKLSVTKIVTPLVFDPLGHPLPGGLYDLVMGPFASGKYVDPCATCGKHSDCPGHFGHIELCAPVYNPVFVKTVYDILKMSCLECFKLQISDDVLPILMLQLKLLDFGYDIEAQELNEFKHQSKIFLLNEAMTTENDLQIKMNELENLLKRHEPTISVCKTKNTESLRSSIINTTLKQSVAKFCRHCKCASKSIKYSYKRLVISLTKHDLRQFYTQQNEDKNKSEIKASNKAILADECRQYLRKIFEKNAKLLKSIFPVLKYCSTNLKHPVDVFFFDVIPVTPSTVRLANVLRETIVEHPQTNTYKKIVEANSILRAIVSVINKINVNDKSTIINDEIQKHTKAVFDMAKGEKSYEKMYNAWQMLQTNVDQIWDLTVGKESDITGQGVKQIIEKKEGLIRMHMMGKRVNYAARTVITPDPYINVDEIGVPDKFAKKLSYPVPVTPWNISELRKLVNNGPNIHPGANLIEDEKGHTTIIPEHDEQKRQYLANTLLTPTHKGMKIVHRHLQNGDILLLNRQPSLHRPSIMGHKARILKGEKTFRLHYSNCKSYNADFDGDEMNAHFPQNELGRSEGYNLANVSNNYLVPKDGTPLGGLIQDHVISGVRISMRGRFFNKEDYQQLVYVGLGHTRSNIKILPPAILKPYKLWSGKQILSTIIINVIPKDVPAINLKATAKINAKSWQSEQPREWKAGGTPFENDADMSEAEVIICGGELLVGVLDKTHYGATCYGLIHCMYELYGGNCSTQLLTSFAKLFTYFLQRDGFTLGVHDILLVPEAESKRRKIIKKCRLIGNRTTAAALDLPLSVSSDELADKMEEAYRKNPQFKMLLDRQYKSALDTYTNKINKICLPAGLLSKFPENNLQLMVSSGAKGSTVNTMQISCLLGQIELEGKRPPLMISGKSLPSFLASETSPKSGGFIDGRFMTGIQPQEFFFHCMAGREGLIDTAVKTSRSGYLQRCLIKHFEGVSVNYDLTVRDSDNSIVQFYYGEDGMDISKAQFLKPKQLSFLDENAAAIIKADLLDQLKNDEITDMEMLKHKKKLRSWIKHNGKLISKTRSSDFQLFSKEIKPTLQLKKPNKLSKTTGRRKIDKEIINHWYECDSDTRQKYSKNTKCPDPIFAKYKPDTHFGSISEHLESIITEYLKSNPDRKKEFNYLMCIKSMNSLVSPGDPVGLLAAQSIGEPSTQMTLNTFHFAGRGEMNVTLGIPRLREILMMASVNIKTPSMDIPFKQHANMVEQAEKLRLKLARVTVADVLESINVQTHIILEPTRANVITLRFNFLPKESYADKFGVKPKQILRYMQEIFFKLMFKEINRASTDKSTVIEMDLDDNGKKSKANKKSEEYRIDEQEPEDSRKPRSPQDSSDEEDAGNADDEDATAAKLKSKNADTKEYDEPADDEEKKDADEDGENDLNDDDKSDNENVNVEEEIENVKTKNAEIEEYTFDKSKYLWCKVTFQLSFYSKYKTLDFSTILKHVANAAVITHTPAIKRAITYTNKDDLILKTDGINIVEMFKYNKILDLNRLYSNDIHAIANTYGIEAAARVIVQEIKNVFNVYGITVDSRHLSLVADYMTFDGTFKPLSRRGIETSASPLQQMSFESSAYFLRNGIVSGQSDNLESPSSCLMVGQPCRSGTGAFSLITYFDPSNLKSTKVK